MLSSSSSCVLKPLKSPSSVSELNSLRKTRLHTFSCHFSGIVPGLSALCVSAQSSRTFPLGHLLLWPLKAFVVFLHWVSSSCCCLQRLIIDSFTPSLRAAALFPFCTDRSIAFNLKAASYAFLRAISILRVYARHAKWLLKVTIKTSIFFTSPFPSVLLLKIVLERPPYRPVSRKIHR